MISFILGFGLCLFLCLLYRDLTKKKEEPKEDSKTITFNLDELSKFDRGELSKRLRACAVYFSNAAVGMCHPESKRKEGWGNSADSCMKWAVKYLKAAEDINTFEGGDFPDWLKNK